MYFTDYNTYLLESYSEEDNSYYFYVDHKQKIIYICLLNNSTCIGYIEFGHYVNEDWELSKVAAEKGYGFKMYEAAMDLTYPEWIVPNRNKIINLEISAIYDKFINRSDIETQKITAKDDSYVKVSEKYDSWFNRRYRLKNELNIEFIPTNYKFIKNNGIKLFDEKHKHDYKPSLD